MTSLIRRGNSVVRLRRRILKTDPWEVYDALHERDGRYWISFPSKPMLAADGAALRDERGKVQGEFEASVIVRFVRNWVRRPAYLTSLARGDVRRDLDGHPTEVPDAAAQRYAHILQSRRGVTP